MGVPGADEVRAHREVQPEEAAREDDQGIEGPGVRPLRVPPRLPDTLGRVHGPAHVAYWLAAGNFSTTRRYVHPQSDTKGRD